MSMQPCIADVLFEEFAHATKRSPLDNSPALLASLAGDRTARGAAGGRTGGDRAVGQVRRAALHYGINEIQGVMPDGRPATIIMAHRENGNARGYDLFLVYALAAKGLTAVAGVPEITDRRPESGEAIDVIGNAPFDGEAEAVCVTDAAASGTDRSTEVVEVVSAGDGLCAPPVAT